METQSNEFPWRVHAAMESWTTRADVKASILLAFQGGMAVFVGGTRGTEAAGTTGAHLGWPAVAVLGLTLAATLATAAVLFPILGSSRRHRAESGRELIYFGHLRLRRPETLTAQLEALTRGDELAMLTGQIVRMSRLNWRKHRLLQLAVALTVLAVALLGVTSL